MTLLIRVHSGPDFLLEYFAVRAVPLVELHLWS